MISPELKLRAIFFMAIEGKDHREKSTGKKSCLPHYYEKLLPTTKATVNYQPLC